jgi:ABC-type Zn2+ transport system substrate-binding protein/surface adhesin
MLMVRDDCLFIANKQSSLAINIINKQSSHHHHQQTNNHLSPLPSTNKQSSLTITIKLMMLMARDDCLFVGGNGEK